MKFSEVVDQAIEFLRRRERVSYRALKREFDLDDDSLEDLKAELIDAKRLAIDEDSKVLIWTGAAPVPGSKFQVSNPQPLNRRIEAEACFLKAIDIACKQQAKSLELRAVMSLARLRQQQVVQSESRNTEHVLWTKLDEAHQMLSEVYDWFTEGFDTKDLQEAKILLETLEH
jgi:hypothetical protein